MFFFMGFSVAVCIV